MKDFDYQVDEVNGTDVTKKEDEDERNQDLPRWIKVSKSRFNEIKHAITRPNESKLMTRVGKKNITLKNAEKLLGGIISGKIDKKEARKMYNSIADDANKLNRLEPTKPSKKILPLFRQLQEIFMEAKADDEVDDEVDDKTDNEADEQLDTTDMPELESEESAKQR